MIKRRHISIFLLACMVFLAGCSASAEEQHEYTGGDAAAYLQAMIVAAEAGELGDLKVNLDARNAVLLGCGETTGVMTINEFLENFEEHSGFALNTNYLRIMIECCLSGDMVGGQMAETKRNTKIDTLGMSQEKISVDDLYLLAKLITAEAGSSWLPMEWKMKVGEVVLNRMASPEFPDSMEEVIYQSGQYANVNTSYFEQLVPFRTCLEAAARLLSGERVLNDPTVVFQSGTKQGEVHSQHYDSIYGYTYFCRSNHPELYSNEGGA